MVSRVQDVPAERDQQPFIRYRGLMWLPHYNKKEHWVAPGGETRTTNELLTLGGQIEYTMLWPRYWTSNTTSRAVV
jgi:hypothetical protein